MIVNGWKPLTTKHSILDVEAALDPPLIIIRWNGSKNFQRTYIFYNDSDSDSETYDKSSSDVDAEHEEVM